MILIGFINLKFTIIYFMILLKRSFNILYYTDRKEFWDAKRPLKFIMSATCP
jgi:hypothetical protein